jgi:hypothetical protein
MEALLVRVRRAGRTDGEPAAAVVLASLIVRPMVVVGLVLSLVTGRGPGGRVLRWNAGARRQRSIREQASVLGP